MWTIERQNTRSRTQADGETALFAGLLWCMDCGSVMRSYHDGRKRKDGSKSTYRSYACGRYAMGGKSACTAHIMNQRVLIEVVLTDIRAKAELAKHDPDSLIERVRTQRKATTTEEIKRKLEELDRPTLLRLVQRIDIGERKVEDGREVRDIRIHYNFVGYIEA